MGRRYFDGVNMATRITCPGIMTVGLIDTACPPSSVFAAFNALGGPKRMHVDVAAGHTNTPEAGAATTEAIRQHFAVMTTGRPRVDVA